KRKLVTPELPPHQLAVGREMDFRLRIRHLLDGIWIERRVRHEMRKRRARRRKHGAHFLCPPCSRMRGSRIARAMSDMSIPITVRNARNIRKDPARYMSWLCSALISIGPVVSSDSTI